MYALRLLRFNAFLHIVVTLALVIITRQVRYHFVHYVIYKVKDHFHFSMLESKLWHSEIEDKNVTGLKVGFIKTCD